ncbi:hypothetical protein GW17_00003944 [Ensete ventricosum]|uniref:Uncharacterized protein n=1 Tax=Ensete ventricosum TaxID=4639 RepID=A0A444G983_ENSVE|nr:hypothetical protein B296_00012493 [Ensete ventricosum]RWW31433.1 hypothetical protein GW17_00003944 [Ensete ventricosum]
MDDYVGIPEDLRCKRSDGKQWRCSALSMPDKTVCEKHYIQAKRRAANSAQRASERKARRKSLDDADIYLESRSKEPETSRSMSPMNVGGAELPSVNKYKEKMPRGQALYSRETARSFSAHGVKGRSIQEVQRDALHVEENQVRSVYKTPPFYTEAKNYNGSSRGVEIELVQFIKGYSEECMREDGQPEMLRIKDWPTPGAVEEFILCQRPEFLGNFPLVEFVHYKWGILNLAAKLPHDAMQNEVGPKLVISYGTHKELDKGDPVANLQVNMGDMVGPLIFLHRMHFK